MWWLQEVAVQQTKLMPDYEMPDLGGPTCISVTKYLRKVRLSSALWDPSLHKITSFAIQLQTLQAQHLNFL